MYEMGLIGNCQTSALIDKTASLHWLCLPRPDSPPVFGGLLDKNGGAFSIAPTGEFRSKQHYIPNTNILVTHFFCSDGSEFQVTDFCPRFEQYGRIYRPTSLFRIVEPVKGAPAIKVSCRPVNGWQKEPVAPSRGNSHLRYELGGDIMRLATNMALTYLTEESEFALRENICFALTWGSGLEDDIQKVSYDFLERTIAYWRLWVKHCSIPSLFQSETIRSALTLKLHCFEDTGAILAALTTSLPEEPGNQRNWDYRYCWLRDAAFVVSAFHNLGHFEEMEGFLKFLLNVAKKHENERERLRPVYALDQSLPLPEMQHSNWNGWKESRPVRSNNQAAEHVQNDVYGETILALAPVFFDERFRHLRNEEHENLLIELTRLCMANIAKPDAGLWEIRDAWREHSFSNLMSWAGIERVLRIRERGFLQGLDERELKDALVRAQVAVQRGVKDGALRNGPDDPSLDASLLLLPMLRYSDTDLSRNTVLRIFKDLAFPTANGRKGFLYRYSRPDDFGKPKSAFLICSFWLVQALAKVGEIDKAREVMADAVTAANSLGLFPEDFVPDGELQLGNFPQAYSHVGLINAAFAVSPPWSEVL
jgi:GH15 family glucan-1,4-alpha-glucosidase